MSYLLRENKSVRKKRKPTPDLNASSSGSKQGQHLCAPFIDAWMTSWAGGAALKSNFFIVHWWHVWNVMANSQWSLGPSFPPSLTTWDSQRQFGSCSALKTHSDMDQPALHPDLLVSSAASFRVGEIRFWCRRSKDLCVGFGDLVSFTPYVVQVWDVFMCWSVWCDCSIWKRNRRLRQVEQLSGFIFMSTCFVCWCKFKCVRI